MSDYFSSDPSPIGQGEELEPWKPVPSQWAASGNNYQPVPATVKKLPAGLYEVHSTDSGIMFRKKAINVDVLLKFPDTIYDDVLLEIEDFWQQGDAFKEHGFLHRRGYLFYGPPGSGKTCMTHQIIQGIVDAHGIVFICHNPAVLSEALGIFRTIEKDRPVVCLFEDIDALIAENKTQEEIILQMLDGENQIDKVLNIATSNYPEKLDRRLTCRPRRFDRIIRIENPNDDIRRDYFMKKLKLKASEVGEWVKASEGFSFAACAELVIGVKCLGNDFEQTATMLQELLKSPPAGADGGGGPVGFGRNDATLVNKQRLRRRRLKFKPGTGQLAKFSHPD